MTEHYAPCAGAPLDARLDRDKAAASGLRGQLSIRCRAAR